MSDVVSPYGELVESRLRILSWNVWWRFGPWEERLPAIAATLAQVDADVICLQEVWEELDTGRNQADLLAEGLGYASAYASRLDWDDARFGNAVLSRWPITGADSETLPAPDDADESRTVLRADIDGPNGPLQVFTSHLNWRFDQSDIRQEQVRAICEFIRASPPRTFPPILCGDFNAVPDSDEIRMLTGRRTVPVPKLVFHDAWEAAGDGPGITWSNDNPFAARDLEPDRRIDYVFAGWPKDGGRGQVLHSEVIGRHAVKGIHPSDHYGVLAELRY